MLFKKTVCTLTARFGCYFEHTGIIYLFYLFTDLRPITLHNIVVQVKNKITYKLPRLGL